MFNNYKINKTHNVKKTCYNFNDNITLNKASINYSNDTCDTIKTNSTFNATDNQYFTKKTNNTSTISNNITRHNHNNYEHYVIKHVHTHIKHINSYDAEINYYKKGSLNKQQYCNIYHDNFNFRKIDNISLTQQTDTTNHIAETNSQTITYGDDNYLNNNKIATVILNPTPSFCRQLFMDT